MTENMCVCCVLPVGYDRNYVMFTANDSGCDEGGGDGGNDGGGDGDDDGGGDAGKEEVSKVT